MRRLLVLLLLAGCGERASDLAKGKTLYDLHCASCHGLKLEGQPNWQTRMASRKLPAPPHDETGHTWHHTDEMLFGITKFGLVPPYAPPAYPSDMPAFGGVLSDEEIRAVLGYIKSHWKSPDLLAAREQLIRNARKR